MLRYGRQTKPGLVALYDIQPGNESGSILTTPEPARGSCSKKHFAYFFVYQGYITQLFT